MGSQQRITKRDVIVAILESSKMAVGNTVNKGILIYAVEHVRRGTLQAQKNQLGGYAFSRLDFNINNKQLADSSLSN